MRSKITSVRVLILMVVGVILSAPASAQLPNENADKPLEITASQTLEWHRNDEKYIARGDVVVVQGDVTIRADMIVADYRETAAAAMDIYRLTATGNVTIESRGNVARGDLAVYDVAGGLATMTGEDLALVGVDQTVSATDKFEYMVPQGRLRAIGGAVATRGVDRLMADELGAIFEENAQGAREVKTLTADGNVVIKTQNETLRGARGIYDAATNIAQIFENVRIERDQNVLEGQRAEINLTTNISKMYGDASAAGTAATPDNLIGAPTATGRVRGVFFPGGVNNPASNQAAPPEAP